MNEDQIALFAAIYVLEDTVESGRMPSGMVLEPNLVEIHRRAVERLCEMLSPSRSPSPNP